MAEKNEKSVWDPSADIYSTVDSIENLKKKYIDESETTLALGIFGFLGDLEAKKIQSAIIRTGELGNEMFPSRAKLEKNVLTHAIYQNVTGINATPAQCTIAIGIKVADLNIYMENNRFVFDKTSPIFIGDYEFHFDYDIILQRSQNTNMKNPVYSARYDMDIENPISDVTQPYLKQPVLVNLFNDKYVIFNATVRQITYEWTVDKLVTASIIDNKTFMFEFSNQLADFVVIVKENNKTVRITPVFYGAPIESDIEYYCWYLYINDHTVRITFDSASYIPGLNAEVTIEAQTTLGGDGNFYYKGADEDNGAEFVDFNSETYGYTNVTCYMLPVSDSTDGKNRKTKEELQEITPKFALSRGYLTTETDLNNYFNLINTDTNRLKLQKKVDNQLERVWYSYFLIKDEFGNIIPTNTVDIEIDVSDEFCFKSEDGRYVVPAGTYFRFDPVSRIATPIDEADIPEFYSSEYFGDDAYYYISVFNIALCPNPLYSSFYMTNVNKNSFFVFDWVNDNCELQFIANRNNIIRKLLTDRNIYTFTFNMIQSIDDDFKMYYRMQDQEGNVETVNNMKCILLLFKGSEPYRWVEAELINFDADNGWTSSWKIDFETDNGLDISNNIKLLNLGEIGSATSKNYGYFECSPKAQLYILAKFDKEYGRYDLDTLVPGLNGWSVTNRYELEGGLDLFKNYTSMMSTKVTAETDTVFKLCGFPMVGAHYMMDESYVSYFLNALDEKRAYIEYCLKVVENSFDIDLKFFNTYGSSVTYSIGDSKKTMIKHIDLEMKFRIKLVSESDMYTKDAMIKYIKNYVENINDIGDLHLPNLVSELESQFKNTIVYVEFMNYNRFWLGVQHAELLEVEDPHTVPEFINIRNIYNKETGTLDPCIDIECNK